MGGTSLVFGLDDVVSAVAALHAKGVRCTDPVVIPGVVAYANFFDPEGNWLQMAGMPPEAWAVSGKEPAGCVCVYSSAL